MVKNEIDGIIQKHGISGGKYSLLSISAHINQK